ncbi:non-hydrolyzing UDP-N-acetylglucosamine 2-epimerase [Salegentibacter chungangensis]|uniref:UDP-N-acetylglucosamine 2-epimerase (non-hydrolyzing) n=1 Tax=Salegentibacter chungangensis TaxID=1335724 RepID=A0ABW3NQB2_9FLAO
MKFLICFGTRPEAIKMAPLIHEMKRRGMPFKVCVTAQHREMLDQVLDFFEITPDYDFNAMQPGQQLNVLSSYVLKEVDAVIEKEKPDMILVQGDTTSAFIGSFAAFNRQIKVGHIEAGLRTFDKKHPFPEEGNRQLISRITDFHFTPTPQSSVNLQQENIQKEDIYLSGNTIVDALGYAVTKLNNGFANTEIKRLEDLIRADKKIILVTGHRRESFGQGIREVCEALLELVERSGAQVVFPVHLNPKVQGPVKEILAGQSDIHLVHPVTYPVLIWLMKKCDIIISDSGGIQEEAPSLNKPVIVTRSVSERMEGVEAGFSFLTGTMKERIIEKGLELLKNKPDYSGVSNPYGDGRASERIIDILLKSL